MVPTQLERSYLESQFETTCKDFQHFSSKASLHLKFKLYPFIHSLNNSFCDNNNFYMCNFRI